MHLLILYTESSKIYKMENLNQLLIQIIKFSI